MAKPLLLVDDEEVGGGLWHTNTKRLQVVANCIQTRTRLQVRDDGRSVRVSSAYSVQAAAKHVAMRPTTCPVCNEASAIFDGHGRVAK